MGLAPLRMNVKVYCLTLEEAPQLSSTLDTATITGMFAEINRLWAPAGICCRIYSVETVEVARDLSHAIVYAGSCESLRAQLRGLLPSLPAVLERRLWRVALLGSFPVRAGGVYLPERGIIFCAERTPRGALSHATLAHELGHSLGLHHAAAEDNLMNPQALKAINGRLGQACNACSEALARALDASQVCAAREQLQSGPYRLGQDRL